MSINPLPGFNPTSISGCQLWLDAADTSTITGTSPVTAWRDKSGKGNNPTTISGITYSANQQAGYGTINMGSGFITGSIASPIINTILTCFLVVRCTQTTNDNGIHGALTLNQVSQTLDFRVLEEKGGRFRLLTRYPTILVVDTAAVTSSYIIWTAVASSSSLSANINGSNINTVSITTNPYNANVYNIGTTSETGVTPLGWNGFIAEEIIYSGTLNNSQIQQVEGYLAWKWGIQGMTTSYTLSNGVSLVTADLTKYPLDVKALQLPLAQPSVERVVYTKAFPAYFTNSILQITPTASERINGNTSYNLSTSYALSIQASGTNWGILNRYPALLNNYTATQISSSTSVFASTNTSLIFVNLTNQRKTVVLPQISQISPNSSLSMTYTIKDINGMAAFSTLFVTTSGSDLIESYAQPILAIDDNYAAVDLVAQRQTNTWLITNYYYGNL
jgi:hypothetical protein